jgi:CPA2 family monovalent cation:H+ antiporter-2
VVALQPFVPASPVLIVIITLVLLGLLRRQLADFEGHLRAGSELILEMLTHPPTTAPLAQQVQTILPGFEGLATVPLAGASFAVGKSLADLNLRARTGATVLALKRGESGVATPSPIDPLQAGDVLALAGSDDAVSQARALLEHGPTSEHHVH